ncbi:MAG: transposase, partial [Myxococcota bacterium]
PFTLGKTTKFQGCGDCQLRKQCTNSTSGRSLHIAQDEPLQKRLRRQQSTRLGRASLRKRVVVEHRQAHLVAKQGDRARYIGVRKNLFDTRRHAAVLNLETLHLAEVSASNQ